MLAAVAIRESDGGINLIDADGGGRGWFQVEFAQHGITEAQAMDFTFSANFAATLLARNASILQARYGGSTFGNPSVLLQATLASYNIGTNPETGITGNPATIDVGTTDSRGSREDGWPGNYGGNTMQLMDCFD
jgi:hypothetical protein